MRDVEIPEGLKDRVLVSLADAKPTLANTDDNSEQPAEPKPTRLARRNWFRTSAAISACLVFGLVGWQLLGSAPSQIPLNLVRDGFVWNVDLLSEFNGPFVPELPSGWTRHQSLRVSTKPHGISAHQEEKHTSAVFPFVFKARNRAAIHGRLLIAPRSLFSELPANTGFSSGRKLSTLLAQPAIWQQSPGVRVISFMSALSVAVSTSFNGHYSPVWANFSPFRGYQMNFTWSGNCLRGEFRFNLHPLSDRYKRYRSNQT